jgi:hypothetical protein
MVAFPNWSGVVVVRAEQFARGALGWRLTGLFACCRRWVRKRSGASQHLTLKGRLATSVQLVAGPGRWDRCRLADQSDPAEVALVLGLWSRVGWGRVVGG